MNTPSHSCMGLVGDIGGTNARFALVAGDGQPLVHALTLPTASFADLGQALQAYLAQVGVAAPAQACMAIANPIDGDWLRMTNTAWAFSIEETRQRLGLQSLRMLNDWEAMAMAAPTFAPHELLHLGGGEPVPDAPRGLLGAGTGLGVSSLVRSRQGEWVPIAGEGGHVTLSPGNAREADILRVLWQRWPHVSAERVISGMGLENLHAALAQLHGVTVPALSAADITQGALSGQDALCLEAVETMCVLLGRVAGNLALTLGARGGIYIGGGVVAHLRAHLPRSGFRQAFEDKGRFADFLSRIPTWVIEAEQPALRGAAMALGVRVAA
ncbi:MAG: glucokinase [Limnohabitans sp.]|nr:MAG: glucokinase [Limnohabitans sp.]